MLIKAENLNIAYGSYLAAKDISLDIKKGEITTIIGPNGSGKSTVLKALTRLLPYKSGQIIIDNKELKDFQAREFAKIIAVLPQRHTVPPDFKVRELVSYGRVPYQKWYQQNSTEDEKIVDWAMNMTGVTNLSEKTLDNCSGGEAQRVWIATILAQEPEILFLDEPTTFLDIAYQQETMKLVKKLNKDSGIGIVMVLHDIAHTLEISDKVLVIKDGQKHSYGTPEEVITPKMLKEVYGINCKLVNVDGRKKAILVYDEID